MATIEVINYGPFEIEVGSPVYERLSQQEKLPDFADAREVEISPDEPGPQVSLTRDELNQRATEAGVAEPEKLSTKADVVAAIESAPSGETLA